MRDGTSSLEAMTTDELNISLALAAPGSAVAVPAQRQLASIAFVLSARAHDDSRRDGTGMPLSGGYSQGHPRLAQEDPQAPRRSGLRKGASGQGRLSGGAARPLGHDQFRLRGRGSVLRDAWLA